MSSSLIREDGANWLDDKYGMDKELLHKHYKFCGVCGRKQTFVKEYFDRNGATCLTCMFSIKDEAEENFASRNRDGNSLTIW